MKKKKQSRFSTAVVTLLAVVLLGVWALRSCRLGLADKAQVSLSPSQVENLRAIGQWEFLSITDEELADTVRPGFFSDDELVRIYSGTLRLGIDMADVADNWIWLDNDTLRVLLPPVKLLDPDFVDEAAARPFYETGTWSQQARLALARQARRKMLARCLTPQNIASAEQNATAQFHHLLTTMGFPFVTIRFSE